MKQISVTFSDCTICKNKESLKKVVFIDFELKRECSDCKYDSRPFGFMRRLENERECSCQYKEIEVVKVSCENCDKIKRNK